MNNYVADPLQIKPIDHIVRWASNRHSYCYKDNLEADYTYHGGVYKRLQEKIPELLLQDQALYEKLEKRIEYLEREIKELRWLYYLKQLDDEGKEMKQTIYVDKSACEEKD